MFLLSVFIAVIGIALLSAVGGFFIEEITQEVSVADGWVFIGVLDEKSIVEKRKTLLSKK